MNNPTNGSVKYAITASASSTARLGSVPLGTSDVEVVAVAEVGVVDPCTEGSSEAASSPSPPGRRRTTAAITSPTSTSRTAPTSQTGSTSRSGSSSPTRIASSGPAGVDTGRSRRDPPAEASGRAALDRGSSSDRAAPSATASFGWTSMATGRPIRWAITSPTTGMRLDPPASRTAWRSCAETAAEPSARCIAVMVRSTIGRKRSSTSDRVRRISPVRSGRSTAITTSSSVERLSLATTTSRRSRSSARRVVGSSPSTRPHRSPKCSTTSCITMASRSTPPTSPMPTGSPRISKAPPRRASTVASNVPPPKS